jgi:predicted phosphodiesterase
MNTQNSRKYVGMAITGLLGTVAMLWGLQYFGVIEARQLSIFAQRSDGKPVYTQREPYIQNTSATSATIVWNTTEPASTLLEYRLEGTTKWQKPVIKSAPVRQHVVKLTGLKAASRYRYRVGSNGRLLREATLQTNKLPSQPFRMAIWGDSGVGGSGQKQLAAQIEKSRPDVMLHTGDLIYPRGAWRHYDPYFFSIYKNTLMRVPFYGSLGNHDVMTQDGQPFLANFVLPRNGPAGLTPERSYSFDYANVHVAVVDSNQRSAVLRDKVVPWLEQDLKRSRAIWKFVVFHHPPFSSGGHGDSSRTQKTLVPVLSRLGVDVVFNGHDHVYERFKPQGGVVYIVTGAGGAERYPRKQNRDITAFFDNNHWSFTQLDMQGRSLRGRQITKEGKILDTWSLSK